jgi:hypothetical protein
MQAIAAFQDSRIGVLTLAAPTDPDRTGLACATAAQIAACHWVPQDMMAWVDVAQPGVNICNPLTNLERATKARIALAHVRRAAQCDSLKSMLDWVQCKLNRLAKPPVEIDVYLVGGYAQAEPADTITTILEGNMIGMGAWTGVGTVYGHIKKPNAENTNQNNANGHIPAFVAEVTVGTAAMYPIGTSDIAGCIAVLAVPKNAGVVMRKVHIYDRNHTVVQGAAGLAQATLDRIGFP